MLHLRFIAILGSGLLLSQLTFALGLGEINAKSDLGVPLKAEIEVISSSHIGTEELIARLASNAEFSRLGVTRLPFLGQLKFQLRTRDDGSQYLLATSRKPVNEPFLNFILELQWANGQLLREYAILLDPPLQSSANADDKQQEKPAKTQSPQKTDNISTTSSPSDKTTNISGQSYQTRSGDSLWRIASRARPSGKVSIKQTMQALHELNKSAFVNDNINRLKVNQVLTIPSESEILHYSALNARNYPSDTGSASQQKAIQQPAASIDVSPQIKAEPVELEPELYTTPTPSNIRKPQQPVEQDELRLLDLQEELSGAKQDVNQLQSTYSELMEEKATLLRTLLQQYEELENLKQKRAELTAQLEQQQTSISAAPSAVSTNGQPLETIDTDTASESSTILANDEQAPRLISVTANAPVLTEPSMASTLRHPAFIASIVTSAILFLALIYLIVTRKKTVPLEPDSTNDMPSREQVKSSLGNGKIDNSPATAIKPDPTPTPKAIPTETRPPRQAAKPNIIKPKPETQMIEDEQSEDLDDELAETIRAANIYLAYGRLKEAKSLIQSALQQEPEREDLQLMLLELYCKEGNSEAFDEQAEILNKNPSLSAQQQLQELRLLMDRPVSEITNSLLSDIDDEIFLSDEELGLDQNTSTQQEQVGTDNELDNKNGDKT